MRGYHVISGEPAEVLKQVKHVVIFSAQKLFLLKS